MVDRRRFDDDGELRSDWKPGDAAEPVRPEEPAPPPKAPPRAVSAEGTPSRAPEAAASPLFLDLINDLAQQAALLMHGAEGLPAQPEHSRRLIDYLGVLEAKTRGNLSDDESRLLSSVLYQLRAAFVQRKT